VNSKLEIRNSREAWNPKIEVVTSNAIRDEGPHHGSNWNGGLRMQTFEMNETTAAHGHWKEKSDRVMSPRSDAILEAMVYSRGLEDKKWRVLSKIRKAVAQA
jgi:hypothetical protein